jgi:hypothetical protein
MKRTREDRIGGLFGLLVVLPCVASIIVGGFVTLGGCLKWLDTAVWETPTLHDGLIPFFGPSVLYVSPTGHLGLDKMITWALGSPLALWLIVIGPAIWFFGWTLTIDKIRRMFSQ